MLNEFRQDPISGIWTLFATGRAKDHVRTGQPFHQLKDGCLFEDVEAAFGQPPIVVYNKGRKIEWQSGIEWTTLSAQNKFPALTPGVCVDPRAAGAYMAAEGHGSHEIVLTRDHYKSFPEFTAEETVEILTVFRERMLALAQDSCGAYVSILHNHGPAAGATIFHNHSQILSLPVVPSQINEGLRRNESYLRMNGKSVFDVVRDAELADGGRIIFQNDSFWLGCPYASRTPYEMRIAPKRGLARFEQISDADIVQLAEVLNAALRALKKSLNDPDYNFYINTAPTVASEGLDEFFSWHLEIVPRVKVDGGEEIGTGLNINEVAPEAAAAKLKAAL